LLPNGKSVLVVDDKDCIRTSMSLVLESLGYSVRSAEDGRSALREIRSQNPDILLSDLTMPGMSGFELLIIVRQSFPAIQVIATSGSFSSNEVPDGVLADAFFPKGSSVSALLQILRRLKRRFPSTSAFNLFARMVITDMRHMLAHRWGITDRAISTMGYSWGWARGPTGAIATVGEATASTAMAAEVSMGELGVSPIVGVKAAATRNPAAKEEHA
jgi:CheY-like chemotaxis protein